jgi:hypothetical protein
MLNIFELLSSRPLHIFDVISEHDRQRENPKVGGGNNHSDSILHGAPGVWHGVLQYTDVDRLQCFESSERRSRAFESEGTEDFRLLVGRLTKPI